MNTTEFKGFEITSAGRFYVTVPGTTETRDGFNYEGYATLSGAKGAITKHVNHLASLPPAEAPATTPEEMTAIVVNCDAIAIRAENDKSKSDAESDKVMAELRYHGFVKGVHGFTPKQPDSRSRNKREGRYAGTVNGEHGRMRGSMTPDFLGNFHVPPKTRKQRKAAKLANKA